MGDLQTAIAELDTGQPLDELVAAIKARKVQVVGLLSGAQLSGVLIQAGLLALIEDQRRDVGNYTPLRNICIGIYSRMAPNGEIDMADASYVTLLDAFLANPTVISLMTSAGTDAATVRAQVMALASTEEQEFLGVRGVDVERLR
jgi:hypothetical protein